jgi:type IV secretory pathway VirB4 component
LIHRCATSLGRWIAIADPKGEYRQLADVLGLQVIDLHPGGTTRLNPLDIGASSDQSRDTSRERTLLVGALVSAVLRRELTALEDAVVGWVIDEIGAQAAPTLADVRNQLLRPSRDVARRANRQSADLVRDVEPLRLALDKLLDQSLRGMFDGHSGIEVDWSRRGIVLDLSRVHHEPDALGAVMIAATAWLQSVLSRTDGPPRIQVLDEAWSLLSSERTSRYLQSSLKLGRAYGVANVLVIHRLSDLRSQADDGTATSKIAAGLLADTQTRVLFRQASDQLCEAQSMLGLNSKETELLGKLSRGRAIWKIGSHTAVVAHEMTDSDAAFCDTDERMSADGVR